MIMTRYIDIQCDHWDRPVKPCYARIETSTEKVAEARKIARQLGWISTRELDLCPACQKLENA